MFIFYAIAVRTRLRYSWGTSYSHFLLLAPGRSKTPQRLDTDTALSSSFGGEQLGGGLLYSDDELSHGKVNGYEVRLWSDLVWRLSWLSWIVVLGWLTQFFAKPIMCFAHWKYFVA